MRETSLLLLLCAAAAAAAATTAAAAAVAPGLVLPVGTAAAGLLALALLAVVVPRPRLALVLLLVTVVARLGDVLSRWGISGAYLLVLLLAALSALHGWRRGTLRVRPSVVHVAAVVLVGVQLASVPSAVDPFAALAAVRGTVEALIFLLVVVVLASAGDSLRTLVGAAVATAAALALLSLLQEVALGGANDVLGLARTGVGDLGGATGRHSGPHEDANVWGRNLVVLLPMALALRQAARRRASSATWALAAVALLTGIYLTQSRGALLATAVAVTGWVLLGARHPRRAGALLVLGACCVFVLPGVGSRLLTLTDVAEAPAGAGDPSLVGRVTAFEHGMAMIRDNPLLGVGAGNFVIADADYRMRAPTYYPKPLAAHNHYLEVLAENGVIGALGWLFFLGSAGFVSWRALTLARRTGLSGWERALPAAVAAGLAAWVAASAFLHLVDFHVLLVVVAAGVAADGALRERLQGERAGARDAAKRARRAVPALAAAGTSLLVLAAGYAAAGVAVTDWSARVEGRIVPEDNEFHAYVHDVGMRQFLATTYAELSADVMARHHHLDDRVAVEVTSSAHASVITLEATSSSRSEAVATAERRLADVVSVVAAAPGLYAVVPLSPRAQVEQVSLVRRGRLALVVGCSAAVGALVLALLRRRQSQGANRSAE